MKMILGLLITSVSMNTLANYEGSHASDVWSLIKANPYEELSTTKVNMKRLTKWGKNKLAASANRTLDNKSDVLDYFEKLVHPNGACLLGKWEINKKNPYSGYFKNGSKGIIISRSSVALSGTKRGKYRGFGLTGKIYPTVDLDHAEKLKTANFFTVDDLGGTKAPKYMGVKMTNEPKVSFHFSSIFMARMAAFVSSIFKKADVNPSIRQLWQISELGETSEVITPMWMRLSARSEYAKSKALDFRDEIRENLEMFGEVVFDIEVSGFAAKDSSQAKKWNMIGSITYSDFSASKNCDHRLHFNHPKFKNNLN